MFPVSIHLSKPNLQCATTHCKKPGFVRAIGCLLKTTTLTKSTPSHLDPPHISQSNLQFRCFAFCIFSREWIGTNAGISLCHFRLTAKSESLVTTRNLPSTYRDTTMFCSLPSSNHTAFQSNLATTVKTQSAVEAINRLGCLKLWH